MARKFPIGAALHQIPKDKEYRKLFVAPPGCYLIVADVDSQETKIMACISQDPELLRIYREGLHPHIVTGAAIGGVAYEELKEGKEAEDTRMVELYAAAKVTNLGKNYRMGHKSFDRKGKHYPSTLYIDAHTKWGLTPTEEEVYNWGNAWEQKYSGVIDQQHRFIDLARHYGYAETIAGRRFYIDQWEKNRWKSEASAIMMPIQGTGAEMKYLAIAIIRRAFPQLTFWGEIHDEIIYTYAGTDLGSVAQGVKSVLDDLPFKKAWNWEPIIPFTWTVSVGLNWGETTEV